MESQSAMPAADAASSVIDVLSARLEDAAACGEYACDAGLLVFLGRVPDRRRPGAPAPAGGHLGAGVRGGRGGSQVADGDRGMGRGGARAGAGGFRGAAGPADREPGGAGRDHDPPGP